MNFPSLEQGSVYLAQEQYAKAIELYEQAIAVAPSVMSNYWHLGLVLLLQGQEAEAQIVWLSAMSQGTPEQVELWTAELIEVLETQAQRREVSGDHATVWLIRQHIREAAPEYLDNLLRLIPVSLRLGLFVPSEDVALLQATELVTREPVVEIDSSLLVQVLQEVWSFDASNQSIAKFAEACIAYYQRALKESPDGVEVLLNLGQVNSIQDKIETAIASYTKVIQIQPDCAEAHLNLGNIFAKQAKYEEALASFQTALQINPNFAEAHLNLGNLLRQQGKIEAALASYQRVLEINLNCVDVYYNLAENWYQQDQMEEALACLHQAIKIKPDYVDAYLGLAKILYQQEKVEEAISCYKKILEMKPHSVESYLNLGRIYYIQGKNAEGFKVTSKAAQLPPDYLDLEEIQNPEFWQNINPDLSVGKDLALKPETELFIDEKQLQELLLNLKEEGYFQIDGLIPAPEIEKLATGIERLRQHHIRPAFILVYDEVWQIFRRLSPLLSAILGSDYREITFWAWYLDSKKTQTGWRPHMDRASKLRPDGITDTFNLWIALTEATPLNGCMYIVPANFDPFYGTDVAQPKFPLQSIRALPAPAGSILGWNGRVWHWGGRSSTKATHPRISIAKEFQRGDVAPHEHPALDPFVRLSLSERLGLAGLHILKYRAYPS